MPNDNDFNNPDKRLKQDSIEQEKKANASTGLLVGVIILIVIIVGIYLYNRPAVESQNVNPGNAPVTNVNSATGSAPDGNTTNPTNTMSHNKLIYGPEIRPLIKKNSPKNLYVNDLNFWI